MRRIFPHLFLLVLLMVPMAAFAQPATGFVPIAPIPGLTQDIDPSQPNGIADFLNNFYRFLIGLAAVITVIQIIRGGLLIATQESIGKHSEGREIIQQSLLGLLLVLSPVLVFSIINPGILTLSYTLPPIDTVNSTPAGNQALFGGPGGLTSTTTSSGVLKKTGGTYLKSGTFTSQNSSDNDQAASTWISTDCNGSVWNVIRTGTGCPGGYSSTGQCIGGSTTYAFCALPSANSFMFVDVDTGLLGSGYGGFATGYTLRGTDTSASQFISTCSGEGGHACAQKNGSLTPVSPCPTYSFTIPQNAPNASGGGNCYSTTLVCSPNNNIDKASLCKGNVTLTP